jgi:hypothetical protein
MNGARRARASLRGGESAIVDWETISLNELAPPSGLGVGPLRRRNNGGAPQRGGTGAHPPQETLLP